METILVVLLLLVSVHLAYFLENSSGYTVAHKGLLRELLLQDFSRPDAFQPPNQQCQIIEQMITDNTTLHLKRNHVLIETNTCIFPFWRPFFQVNLG